MRAARLLHLLLLLQNRGRMTSTALADELEVTSRTILRDIDALTEAGLPVIAYQGNRGGFELGFNYRARLTGLAADEAEAFAILLADPTPALDALALRVPAMRAASKLIESFTDQVRARIRTVQTQFRFARTVSESIDPRVAALAGAIRAGTIVRLRSRSASPLTMHPASLSFDGADWTLHDSRATPEPQSQHEWGDINISAIPFAPGTDRSPQ